MVQEDYKYGHSILLFLCVGDIERYRERTSNLMEGESESKSNSKSKSTRMIPQEVILLEILPKLPVKSLCQYKSVSKLWNSTISTDPSFLKAQLSHSSSTGLTFLITFNNTYDVNNNFVLSAKINPYNKAQIKAHYKFTRPIRFFMSQSLQGLNLIHFQNPESVVIANTATHQFITLPSPGQEELRHWDIHSFGFDPVRSQHKVLNTRVIYTDILNNEDEIRIEHKILSLSQYSKWRLLNNVPAHIPAPCSRSICIDGFVYYTARLPDPSSSSDDRQYISDDQQYIIVEFDVSREKFDFIELPDPIVDTYCSIWYVLVNYCNGQLGLVKSQVRVRDGNDMDNILDMWILREGENGEERRSWINKKFKIPVDLRKMNGMNICGFNVAGTVHSTGEVIIMNPGPGNPCRLNLYNLETNCVRKIEISEFPKDLNPYHCTVTDVCDHVESLWPLNI